MKNKILYLAIILMILSCFVSCDTSVDESLFESRSKLYSIQEDGSWAYISGDGTKHVLDGTDRPYITVIVNNQPSEIINLTAGISKAIGNGNVSVDAEGECVTYTNTGTAQKVYIRTNRGSLIINGKIGNSKESSDEIFHYGYAVLCQVSVANYCFYTHAIIGEMDLFEGKVVADSYSIVSLLKASSDTKTEEINGGVFIIPENTSADDIDQEVAENLGYKVDASTSTYIVDESTDKGLERKQIIENLDREFYSIGSKEELVFFRDNYNSGNHIDTRKVVLTADIDLSSEKWVPIGTWEYPYHGTFDGQGHHIIGLNPADPTEVIAFGGTTGYGEVFGFFGIVGDVDGDTENDIDVNISNVYFTDVNICGDDIKDVGTVIGYAPTSDNFVESPGKGGEYAPGKWDGNTDIGKINIVMDNVSVSGSMDVKAHAGGLIGKLYSAASATLTNCTSDMSITTHDDGGAACFIGYCKSSTATMNNCYFTDNSIMIFDGNTSADSANIGDYVAGASYTLIVNNSSKAKKVPVSVEGNSEILNVSLRFVEGTTLSNSTCNSVYNYNTADLENCTAKNVYNLGSKLTLSGCTVSSNLNNRLDGKEIVVISGTYNTLTNNSLSSTEDKVSVTINGGSFTTIKNFGYRKMLVDGSTVSINSFTNSEKGIATIKSGTVDSITNKGDITISGGNITTKLTQYATATISGGTFTTMTNGAGATATISGGTFTEKIAQKGIMEMSGCNVTLMVLYNSSVTTINSGNYGKLSKHKSANVVTLTLKGGTITENKVQ